MLNYHIPFLTVPENSAISLNWNESRQTSETHLRYLTTLFNELPEVDVYRTNCVTKMT